MPLDRLPAQRRRLTVQPRTEPLETRAVMSALLSGTSASQPNQEVEIIVPAAVVAPQAKSLVVTLVRRSTDGSNPARGALSVTFEAQPGAQNSSNAILPFTPLDLPVTFQPGQTIQNITVPLNPDVNVTDPYNALLTVTPASKSAEPTSENIQIVDSPAAAPPTITHAMLLGSGGVVTGVALTFSQPMDPSRAQNRFNYSIIDEAKNVSAGDVAKFVFLASVPTFNHSIPLSAAVYDANTNTVDLLFRHRQTDLGPYQITNAASVSTAPLTKHNVRDIEPLTDVQGDEIAQAASVYVGHGGFNVTVSAPGH